MWDFELSWNKDLDPILNFLAADPISTNVGFDQEFQAAKNVCPLDFNVAWFDKPAYGGHMKHTDSKATIEFASGLSARAALMIAIQEIMNVKNIPRFKVWNERALGGHFDNSLEYAAGVEYIEFEAFQWRVNMAAALDASNNVNHQIPSGKAIRIPLRDGNVKTSIVNSWKELNITVGDYAKGQRQLDQLRPNMPFNEYIKMVSGQHTSDYMEKYDKWASEGKVATAGSLGLRVGGVMASAMNRAVVLPRETYTSRGPDQPRDLSGTLDPRDVNREKRERAEKMQREKEQKQIVAQGPAYDPDQLLRMLQMQAQPMELINRLVVRLLFRQGQ
jgi:hypothetical protein